MPPDMNMELPQNRLGQLQIIHYTLLSTPGKVAISSTSAGLDTCYVEALLWDLSMSLATLPSSNTSGSPFVLRTSRRNCCPCFPHYFLHVWDPYGDGEETTANLSIMYVVSHPPLIQCFELATSAMSFRFASVLFVTVLDLILSCSHQVLVGQPTNKKPVPLILTPSLLLRE